MSLDELNDMLTRVRGVKEAYENDVVHRIEGPMAVNELIEYLEEKVVAENQRLKQAAIDGAGAFRLTQ